MSQQKQTLLIGRHEAITLPARVNDCRVNVRRDMPCITILIHGVNDVGEAYDAQEKGICAGLNDRLARGDIAPGSYKLPDAKRTDPLLLNPDDVFFRRENGKDAYSPIVPFYWGFREEQARILKNDNTHGEWTDRYGNRLDKHGAKNGGPFANATSTLPDMFGAGYNAKTMFGLPADPLFGDAAHQLHVAMPRHYMVLAAQRLAMVIAAIRRQHPDDTLNIVCHSQGGMVTLLAHAFLKDQGGVRPADCVILNNTPYSVQEPPREADQNNGEDRRQTRQARLATLSNIVKWMTEKAHATPPFDRIKDPAKNFGVTGCGYGAKPQPGEPGKKLNFEDRDNRGKVYLYFSPDDMTTALDNVRAIGWSGVPDTIDMIENLQSVTRQALAQLGPRFRQRVFTKRLRGGKPIAVGLPPHQYVLEKWHESSARGLNLKLVASRGDTRVNETRTINGEALTPLVAPELTAGELAPGVLPVSPIDAANAIANGKGIDKTHTDIVDDPRPPGERREEPGAYLSKDALKRLDDLLNQSAPTPQDRMPVQSAWVTRDRRLEVTRLESANQARLRWQSKETDSNSYHSGIVSSAWNSRHVTAYDLAIGQGHGRMDEGFYEYLCDIADWRMDKKAFDKFQDTSAHYQAADATAKALIALNADYYTSGQLPVDITSCKLPSLVVNQTLVEQWRTERRLLQEQPQQARAVNRPFSAKRGQ